MFSQDPSCRKKKKNFPLSIKTRAGRAQHRDDSARSHEVFRALKVTGHNIPVETFNFLLLLLNMETRSNHGFKAVLDEVGSRDKMQKSDAFTRGE